MKLITSKDNAAIKQVLRIKHKKYRRLEGLFLLEGRKMLEESLARQEMLARVFVDQEYEEEYREVAREHPEIEWFLLDAKLSALLSDTEQPQGIMALARIPEPDYERLSNEASLLLLLDQIADPGNMGTIIRTAWAFGVDGILLTPACVDPFSPKVVRASMGGILQVPVLCDLDPAALNRMKRSGFSLTCSSLAASENIYSQNFTGRKIIVIGNESRGVSPKIQAVCDHYFKIPLNPQVDSLNVAIACAIIIVEAVRQRGPGFLS